MTVKQSETETFNPEPSSDLLDASLDAIISGKGQSAEGSKTPTPKVESVGAQTLMGIGALGLTAARGPFAAFEKKPAADDPEELESPSSGPGREVTSLADPLTAQAAAHRDRALGRLPGVVAQPETPPPPAADLGLTPPPPAPLMPLGFAPLTVESGDLPAIDEEEVEDAAPLPPPRDPKASVRAAAQGPEVREIQSSDLEFEGPDDGPTSLNPEIGQALQDADFFPSFAAPRANEPSVPLFPTGAPRVTTPQFPRLVTPPLTDDPLADQAPFNLTLPTPGRPAGAHTTGALPSVGSRGSQPLVPAALASVGGLPMALPAMLARSGLTGSRMMMGGAFVACLLAGVMIDKAFFHHTPADAPAAPNTRAPDIAPPVVPVAATPPASPAPPAIVPVNPSPAPATTPTPEVAAAPAAPTPTPATTPATPKAAAIPEEAVRPPKPVAVRTPRPVVPADEATPRPVAQRSTTPTEPVAARPASARPAAVAPKPFAPKPPVRPAARPKTKWVDPFAP